MCALLFSGICTGNRQEPIDFDKSGPEHLYGSEQTSTGSTTQPVEGGFRGVFGDQVDDGFQPVEFIAVGRILQHQEEAGDVQGVVVGGVDGKGWWDELIIHCIYPYFINNRFIILSPLYDFRSF